MNKILNNENGYSLLLAVSVFLLFTILGLTIMTASITGAKRNVVSEQNLQAIELANSGIDTLKNYLYEEIHTNLGTSGFSSEQFCQVLDKYDYDNDNEVLTGSTDKGEFIVYLKNDGTICNNLENLTNLTLVSTGITKNGQEKKVEAKIDFGNTELETFKYALSARKSSSCLEGNSCEPGEGNLFLHGGVEITGDIRADGHLITTNQGYENYGLVVGFDDKSFLPSFSRDRWIPTTKPKLIGFHNKPANIVLGGNAYKFDNKINYYSHIRETDFNGYQNITNNVSMGFQKNVTLNKSNSQQTPKEFDIKGQKDKYKFDKSIPNVKELNNILSAYINNENNPNHNVIASPGLIGEIFNLFYLRGNNHFNKFLSKKSLRIDNGIYSNKCNKPISVKFNEGAFINGHLIIGNGGYNSNKDKYTDVSLDGAVYVKGDLIIRGTNAKFNSIMYVEGDVIIENSIIDELPKDDGSNGSLIIFATGSISIRNNNVYNNNFDSINSIRGFFYSQKSIELFGTGSNIKINGGLSAKRIILNGVRGSVSNTDTAFNHSDLIRINALSFYINKDSQLVDFLKELFDPFVDLLNDLFSSVQYFEEKHRQVNKPSRLQIIYDEEMIEETMKTYTDLKAREEQMNINIEEPKVIERDLK